MSTVPWPPTLSSRNICPPSMKKPGSEIDWLGVRLPSSSAASAMKGLKVEPGA